MIKLIACTVLLIFSAVAIASSEVNTNQMVQTDNAKSTSNRATSVKIPFYLDAGSSFDNNAGFLQIKIYGVTFYSDAICTESPRTVDLNTNSWVTFDRLSLSGKGVGQLVGYINYYPSSLSSIAGKLKDYTPAVGGCAKIDIYYRECRETDATKCQTENHDITIDSDDLESLDKSKSLYCSNISYGTDGIIDACDMNAGESNPIDIDEKGQLELFRKDKYSTSELHRAEFKAGQSDSVEIKNTGAKAVTHLLVTVPHPFTDFFTHDCPSTLEPLSSCTIMYHANSNIAGSGNIIVSGDNLTNNNAIFPFIISNHAPAACWGLIKYNHTDTTRPLNLTNNKKIYQLSSSVYSYHTCGITESTETPTQATAACWGLNTQGQLGNGTRTDSPNDLTYVHIIGTSPITQVSSGYDFSCALSEDGHVQCWGTASAGVLGNNEIAGTYTTPVYVCANSSKPGVCDTKLSNIIEISSSARHTCALTKFGSLKCWGYNNSGQLGDGTNSYSALPVDVSGLNEGVADVSAGERGTCATLQNGEAKCWGFNYLGQLGNNNLRVNSNIPVDVCATSSTPGVCETKLNNISFIRFGFSTACARMEDGTVKCWGAGTYGQMGNGTFSFTSLPTSVLVSPGNKLTNISSLTVGSQNVCALNINGELYCWGSNKHAVFGNGQDSPEHYGFATPSLTGLSSFYNLSSSAFSTCGTSPDIHD